MSLRGFWSRLVSRRSSPSTAAPPSPKAASASPPSVPATDRSAAPARAPQPATAAVERSAIPPTERHDERQVRFFCWLTGVSAAAAPGPDTALAGVVEPLLERLDAVIASDALRATLLPRAPHVVPQLMKTLRDETYSSVDVASRISRDVVLTAEVVRSATSVLARGDDDEEIDLARAVQVIGTQGLRRAIANVVLRPIFDAKGSSLSARAATQIWKDADRKARLAAPIAGQYDLDPFDGYLAGLLHNSGWTAVLRAIDNLEDLAVGPAEIAHLAVVPEVIRRRDALFGALVGPWKLGALMDELAAEVGSVGLENARSPLGCALRDADRLAALRALAPGGERNGAKTVPRWSQLAKPVQDAYAGLGS